MTEYKMVYEPYKFDELIAGARKEGGTYGEGETKQWNDALNRQAKAGWTVKNSGVIQSGTEVVFWALMEKPEKVEGRVMF